MRNKCYICDSLLTEELFEKEGHPICQCHHCGVVFLASWPQEETSNEVYDQGYYEEHCLTPQKWQIRFAQEYKARLKLIERMKQGKGRLLDVGTGMGSFLKLAQERGWQVEGVETSSFAAKFAQQNLGLKVLCCSLEQADLERESFDVITAWELIEHLQDPKPLLQRINELLKKDGLLAISTPNYASFPSRLQKGKWPAYHFFYHLNLFTEASLSNLLDKTGFVPVKVVKHNCCCPSFTLGWRKKIITCFPIHPSLRQFIDKYLTGLKRYLIYLPVNLFLKMLRVEGDRLIVYVRKK